MLSNVDSARKTELAQPKSDGAPSARGSTLDPAEVARFGRLAGEWWDANGKFRPLHELGPARLKFIRDAALAHFRREVLPAAGTAASLARALKGLNVLDIGCGGGLVSEPLARMGGKVVGIDPAAENIAAARVHAEAQGLDIDYRAARTEDLAAAGETFDLVVCLEVIEHVPDVPAFVATCARLVKPGGLIVFSTINRTVKAYALAIVAAEYVLGWVPRGTHQWERYVTPDELRRAVSAAGLSPGRSEGLLYDPLRDRWSLGADTDVNYMAAATRPPVS